MKKTPAMRTMLSRNISTGAEFEWDAMRGLILNARQLRPLGVSQNPLIFSLIYNFQPKKAVR